ncbi:MAG: hypothetical protein P1V35_08535 [Planctomycetota bacterium]|nr:hypothetical protein [Planctomycetota bacterium]
MSSTPSSLAFAVALSSFLFCACVSSYVPSEGIDQHVVRASKSGELLDPLSGKVMSDDSHLESIATQAAKFIREQSKTCKPGERPRLMIHIHGGLGSPNAKLESADVANQAIARDNASGTIPPTYPIFVTWPSGFWGTYGDHTTQLRQGRIRKWVGWITSPLYLATDLVSGVVQVPKSFIFQMTTDIAVGSRTVGLGSLSRQWNDLRAVEDTLKEGWLHGPEVSVGTYYRSAWTQTRRGVQYVVSFLPKLVTQAGVDGLGGGAWEVMLHRVAALATPLETIDAGKSGRTTEAVMERMGDRPRGVLLRLMGSITSQLAHKQTDAKGLTQQTLGVAADDGTPIDFDVVLVGHSMGAIALNHLLLELEVAELPLAGEQGNQVGWDLPVTDVVYMAPACSVREASEAVQPFVTHRNKHLRTKDCGCVVDRCKFHVLTLHPLADASEANYDLIVPRGSLLEWIDVYYTTPSTPQDSVLGKWLNLAPLLHLFTPIRKHMGVKVFSVHGDSIPQRHGDFNDGPFWRSEYWSTEGPSAYHLHDDQGIRIWAPLPPVPPTAK